MIPQSRKDGWLGEVLVSRIYRDRKFVIVLANYRTRLGEIDLIVRKKNLMVFCEVKTRRGHTAIEPREAVDYHKQQRVIRAALQFVSQTGFNGTMRFDVAEVWLRDDGDHQVNLIEQAFEG